jgi:hypothetical protein
MDTEALIQSLAQDVTPVRRGSVGRRLTLGIVAGGTVTLIALLFTLGLNPQLPEAAMRYPFWVKWGYSLSLGTLALGAVRQLARPDAALPRWLWLLAMPVLALAAIGIFEMAQVPPGKWLEMWLGKTWWLCPWLVLTLAMPIFIGLLWSFRRLAPTQLRAAGAVAGLAAGAIAAMIYCLHCPEMSAIFVLTWYTLGIVLAAGIGALIGPRVLRW